MKKALRIVMLFLSALVGLIVVGRGIATVVTIRLPGHEDHLRELLEGSVFIAAGICVLSVAVEQINCLRTHHKDESLL